LDKGVYEKAKAFVEKGSYSSVENFIEIAVKNQILLESEGSAKISVNLATQQISSLQERPLSGRLMLPEKTKTQILEAKPLDASIANTPVWGQINRLAPAKLVLRVLLNALASTDEKSVDLKRFSAEIAETATAFRLYASRKDKTVRVRGEDIFIAFPKKDPSSQQRFLNYYVGKGPLSKWTDSIILGLSLAKIEEMEDGSTQIGLTDAGLRFALLRSPLIDDFYAERKGIDAPLSEEEGAFLIDQIKMIRPGEYELLAFILDSIRKGANTPTRLLDKSLEYLQRKDLQIKVTTKVANTMQVGAIGKLVEMRLVKIEKEAQKSKYKVTEKGEKLIGKLQ
jgi:predicted transcriptional regulator